MRTTTAALLQLALVPLALALVAAGCVSSEDWPDVPPPEVPAEPSDSGEPGSTSGPGVSSSVSSEPGTPTTDPNGPTTTATPGPNECAPEDPAATCDGTSSVQCVDQPQSDFRRRLAFDCALSVDGGSCDEGTGRCAEMNVRIQHAAFLTTEAQGQSDTGVDLIPPFVDVYLDGGRIRAAVPFGANLPGSATGEDRTAYTTLPAGTLRVHVVPTDLDADGEPAPALDEADLDDEALFAGDFTFEPNAWYTAWAYGRTDGEIAELNAFGARLTRDDVAWPEDDGVTALGLQHAVANIGPVAVFVRGVEDDDFPAEPAIPSLAFGEAADALELEPGVWELGIAPLAGAVGDQLPIALVFAADLTEPESLLRIFLTGDAAQEAVFALTLTSDSIVDRLLPSMTSVRVQHAAFVTDVPAAMDGDTPLIPPFVDLYLRGERRVAALPFGANVPGSATPADDWLMIPAGDWLVHIVPTDFVEPGEPGDALTGEALATAAIGTLAPRLQPGTRTTLWAYGNATAPPENATAAFGLAATDETATTPEDGAAVLTLFHAAANVGQAQVFATPDGTPFGPESPLLADIAFGTAGEPVSVPPGAWTIGLWAGGLGGPGSIAPALEFAIEVEDGDVLAVFAAGDLTFPAVFLLAVDASSQMTRVLPETGLVRIQHAAFTDDTPLDPAMPTLLGPAVDIWVDGQPIADTVPFGANVPGSAPGDARAAYAPIPAGMRDIAVVPAGGALDDALYRSFVRIVAGQQHLAWAFGSTAPAVDTFDVDVLSETDIAEDGEGTLRIHHATSGTGAVSLRLSEDDGTGDLNPVATQGNVNLGDTFSLSRAPGPVTLEIVAADGDTVLARFDLELDPASASHDVFVAGDLGEEFVVALVLDDDSIVSTITPTPAQD
ncbi:MAG: DUF4397 domain-containing protein [Deltaproteobacteria bacterium]|nr:MAG: DUF4397 domain-containing protein [Deltaproteobacteria bacterium]